MTDSTRSGEALHPGRLQAAASRDATEQPAPAHGSSDSGMPVPGESLPGTAGHKLLQTGEATGSNGQKVSPGCSLGCRANLGGSSEG